MPNFQQANLPMPQLRQYRNLNFLKEKRQNGSINENIDQPFAKRASSNRLAAVDHS